LRQLCKDLARKLASPSNFTEEASAEVATNSRDTNNKHHQCGFTCYLTFDRAIELLTEMSSITGTPSIAFLTATRIRSFLMLKLQWTDSIIMIF
jgi:hypothetical protein